MWELLENRDLLGCKNAAKNRWRHLVHSEKNYLPFSRYLRETHDLFGAVDNDRDSLI